MGKTIRFEKEELETIVDAVGMLLQTSNNLRSDSRVNQSADLTLAIAEVQIRCRHIIDVIKKTAFDPEAAPCT